MIYFMQIMKMLPPNQRDLFCSLFEDLQETIDECGWQGNEVELIQQMILDHVGIEMMDKNQTQMLFDYLMKHQGELEEQSKIVLMATGGVK